MSLFEQHFNTVFWSQKQTETTLPDFQTGFNTLHQKLEQSKVENEEVILFFKDRIAIEELYSTKLVNQGNTDNKNSGFERDEGASLKKCYTKLKETSANFGRYHKATATALTEKVLKPMEDFHEKYKQQIANSKQNIDVFLKQLDSLVKEVEKSRTVYHKKCKEADRAEDLALKNTTVAVGTNQVPKIVTGKEGDVKKMDEASNLNGNNKSMDSVELGGVTSLQPEFDSLIRKMKEEISIGEHRVPFLGRYQNTSSGEDIAKWLQRNLPQCKDSPAMSDIIGQQLIQNYNVLRLIGQRGNKFISSSSSFYQWRINDADNVSLTDSNSTGSYTLGGFMDKVTTATSVNSSATFIENGLEQHKKARREVEKADESYRTSVKRLDQMRMTVEEAMFAHFTEMEQVELQRIGQIKQLISDFAVSLSSSIPKDKTEIEELMVFQESLKPNQDIQYIIQQYAISSFTPKAILYDNYYHGFIHDQIFGVPLEELGKQDDTAVPRYITLILQAIQKGAKELDLDTRNQLWTTWSPLKHIHAACTEFNRSSDSLNANMFEEKDPVLLVGVLRYFLLELPECLMTYEFYDLVDTFFVSGDDRDKEILVPTLSKLIATLPGSHFFTLKAIVENITSYIKEYSVTENIVEFICQFIGSSILRTRLESYTTMTNRLPVKFFKQLITFYNEIFSDATLKLHVESEKRRLAKPLVVKESDIHAFSELKNRSNAKEVDNISRKGSKRSSGLMSSVMGVFQKNSAQNQNLPKVSSITPNRSVSLSFGSPITRSDSPPLSPKNQNLHDIPDDIPSLTTSPQTTILEVMFDIDEAVLSNGYEFENNNKSDAILKDMDFNNNYSQVRIRNNSDSSTRGQFKNGRSNGTQVASLEVKNAVIDSSFFDDDDDY